ncbi:MAG: methyltransferase [Deltaproteobacteria bacterium RIFCSPLOWO2_02_FULL_53_8]|nr:MAG: methyltransferase [Deltaproteobacteria bacterium RIFCSPLOWO2_02_FULL_53_8]
MRKTIKSGLKQLINSSVTFMGKTSPGRYVYAQIVGNAMSRTQTVNHRGLSLIFSIPNALNQYRADSFSSKEPETLEWIDGIPNGSIIWDIGANVGLYSCYSAKQRGCRVFAFEPSVFNLELLARNIFLNGLAEQITIVPLPLSDMLAVNKLNMTSTEWGGALSTFGQEYGYDGKTMNKVFEFPTIGISMVDAVEFLKIPQPDYIKMDVDGIEHLILKGGMPVLSSVKGILIEINDKFTTQANDASTYLQQAGFSLKEKRHAETFDTGIAQYTFNQIWGR